MASSDNTWFAATAFFAGLVAVTLLALLPGDAVDLGINVWDKLQHALAYFLLTLLGLYSFPRHAALAAIALAIHGALIEVAQQSIAAGRVGDPADWLADCVGIALGFLIRTTVHRKHVR
jgi:VanZ family protein